MADKNTVRIDKYLWAVRLYKTRSLATNACKMGRILINDIPVKPSGSVKGDEIITVKKPPINFMFRVVATLENRVSAKLVPDFIEDITPESEKIKLDIRQSGIIGHRKRGSGRPTKKERRIIDTLMDGIDEA